MAKRKAITFCVRHRDADPQSTNGVQLIRGTLSHVESFIISQHVIEPATDIELNELGAAGVKIEIASPAVDQPAA